MDIKITTSQREFTIPIPDMKLQNRNGVGVNILGLINKKLRKNEEISKYEIME